MLCFPDFLAAPDAVHDQRLPVCAFLFSFQAHVSLRVFSLHLAVTWAAVNRAVAVNHDVTTADRTFYPAVYLCHLVTLQSPRHNHLPVMAHQVGRGENVFPVRRSQPDAV